MTRERAEAEGRGRLQRDRDAFGSAKRRSSGSEQRSPQRAKPSRPGPPSWSGGSTRSSAGRAPSQTSTIASRRRPPPTSSLTAERERLAGLERDLAERARAVDAREIEVAGLDDRRRELEEREQAVGATAEEAAERERLLDERERQIAEREESLGSHAV